MPTLRDTTNDTNAFAMHILFSALHKTKPTLQKNFKTQTHIAYTSRHRLEQSVVRTCNGTTSGEKSGDTHNMGLPEG